MSMSMCTRYSCPCSRGEKFHALEGNVFFATCNMEDVAPALVEDRPRTWDWSWVASARRCARWDSSNGAALRWSQAVCRSSAEDVLCWSSAEDVLSLLWSATFT